MDLPPSTGIAFMCYYTVYILVHTATTAWFHPFVCTKYAITKYKKLFLKNALRCRDGYAKKAFKQDVDGAML